MDELTWPSSQDSARFSFTLPHEPYSFTGRLIALTWALEAVLLPSDNTSERYEFDLTPDGQKITLNAVEKPLTAKKNNRWFRINHNKGE